MKKIKTVFEQKQDRQALLSTARG